MQNTPDNFVGGKISHSVSAWKQLSHDSWIDNVLQGKAIELDEVPFQFTKPGPLNLPDSDQKGLDIAMSKFIDQKIVEPCSEHDEPSFYSNVFPRLKPDGSSRVILNLKTLNLHMDKIHFKMDTFKDVTHLVFQNCYFASVDFKHAYYSVPVNIDDRRFLRFIWKGDHYQFTCLPQGLTSAPRIFTKLLKPVMAHLRTMGIVILCYIDDCIFVAESPSLLLSHIDYAVRLFDSLGLTIHPEKSVFKPVQQIEFLGFTIDSVSMTVTLTSRKQDKIIQLAQTLLSAKKVTIRELASFIGNVVAADPAVPMGPLHYKYIEIVKNRHLLEHKGNFDAKVKLQSRELTDISWWLNNIQFQQKSLVFHQTKLELYTDASLSGWGAKLGTETTWGDWAVTDSAHINALELKAVLFGLQALCSDLNNTHICIRSDNTTTVACIERSSSTKLQLLEITAEIYNWAAKRQISLSAIHIPGVDNVDADRASRSSNVDTEWMIDPPVFRALCRVFYRPSIDLFASRINAQLPYYVAWRPDPHSKATDAFTITWNYNTHYAFPPFSIIGQILMKIVRDQADLLLIAPLWATRPWFPRALQLLSDYPVLLPRHCLFLPQDPSRTHPLASKLNLVALPLSGRLSSNRAFHQKLRSSSLRHGETARKNNMGRISRDGCLFASNGKQIPFYRL